MSKGGLLVSAENLRKRSKGCGYIEEHIIDIIQDLNGEIDEAVERSEHHAEIPLPTLFDVPTMSNADAQKRIYGVLLELCLESKYIPKLLFYNSSKSESQKVKLQVRWKTKTDEEEDKYIHSLIQKYSVVTTDGSQSKKANYKSDKKGKVKNGEFKDLKPKYSKDPSKNSKGSKNGKIKTMNESNSFIQLGSTKNKTTSLEGVSSSSVRISKNKNRSHMSHRNDSDNESSEL